MWIEKLDPVLEDGWGVPTAWAEELFCGEQADEEILTRRNCIGLDSRRIGLDNLF